MTLQTGGRIYRPHFDFHGHNDYDFGKLPTLWQLIKAGVHGDHLTVNGMLNEWEMLQKAEYRCYQGFYARSRNKVNEQSLCILLVN
jgi:hypothetical protein